MSRRLKMGEEFTEEVGGYDPRTDFSTEFKSDPNDPTSHDEEIARKLQMAEYEPEVKNINQNEEKGPSFEEKLALQQSYADAQRRNAENRIRSMEQAQERQRREFQQALQADRAEQQRERERLARIERERDEERNKRKALEDIATYATLVRNTYPASFDRIYNWGLTLVPNYYDYETRRLLREQLSKLIKRELLLHSTENEVEDKIRRLINDAEYDIMLKKDSANVASAEKKSSTTSSERTKPKPRKSKKTTSRKPAAKKSHKKSTKRKVKKQDSTSNEP